MNAQISFIVRNSDSFPLLSLCMVFWPDFLSCFPGLEIGLEFVGVFGFVHEQTGERGDFKEWSLSLYRPGYV